MAQDRMLRAGMRTSEKVNSWPIPVRYFWSMLWGYCDDWGRGVYNPRLIYADTFPLDDEVTANQVEVWMRALEAAEVIVPYEVGGKRYFECPGWFEHNPDLKYLKKTTVPGPDGIVPPPGKVSEYLQNISEKSPRREGDRDRDKEGDRDSADGAPPRYCPSHPNGTRGKCGPCGDARRARAEWDNTQKTKPTVPGIITPADCKKHPGRPAKGCDRCAEEDS